MLLNAASDNSVISYANDSSTESAFQIDMNAKAFRTLSDSLYKNKIGSIVREISCNAFDSHIAAGKPEAPFEIHLPNSFEPWFAVKDFGIGLSQDDIEGKEVITENFEFIENTDGTFTKKSDGSVTRKRIGGIYTTLFKSTKDQSNAMIGAFGLGSKTPFAYSDSFTVTSVKDGKKYHYSAYINDKGIPSVLLLSSEDTTDNNGVEVKISVKKDHYRTFETEVRNQLQFFTVKPLITNGSVSFNTSFDADADFLLKTDNIRLRKLSGNYDNTIHAVIGVVGYPLETDQLGTKYTNKISEFVNAVSGNVAFMFNIGELEVTAPREGISYTDKSVDSIIKKLNTARDELADKFGKELDSYGKNLWEKACKANTYGDLTGLFLATGYKINGTLGQNGWYAFDLYTAQVSDTAMNRTYIMNTYKLSDKGSCRRDSRDLRWIVPKDEIKIFIRDTNKKPIARLKEFALANPNVHIHMIDRSGTRFEPEFTDAEVAEFSRVLGDVEIVRISSLPEPARKSTSRNSDDGTPVERGSYTIPTAYLLNPKYYGDAGKGRRLDEPFGTKIFDDFEDVTPSYYLPSERGVIKVDKMYSDGTYNYPTMNILEKIRHVFTAMNREMPDIYVFNAKKIGMVEENNEWKPVDAFIVEALELIRNMKLNVNRFRAVKDAKNLIGEWVNSSYIDLLTSEDTIKQLDHNNPAVYVLRLCSILNRRKKSTQLYDILTSQFSGFFKETDVNPLTETLNAKIKDARTRLPLLEHLPAYYRTDKASVLRHAIQYINIMGMIEPVVIDAKEDTDETPVEVHVSETDEYNEDEE
jgi:hypothetical protein